MQVIPTIFTTKLSEAKIKLKKYKGIFDWIQPDIVDGKFTSTITPTLSDFGQIDDLKFFKTDIHLMVKNPILFLPECLKIDAKRVVGQIELMPSQQKFIQKCKKIKLQSGLAIDFPTPIKKLDQTLLPTIDVLLLMSYKAGMDGQKFLPSVLEKIKKLAKIKKEKNLKFKIALDGGINDETIRQPYKLGVEIFYIGNYLFDKPKEKLAELKRVLLSS